jgi:ubiquitin carboxyl-terminal hydrolase L3
LVLEEESDLEASYKAVVLRGDSAVPDDPEQEVNFHFVCFAESHRDSNLYELDETERVP